MTTTTSLPIEPKAYSYLRFSTPEQAKGDSTRRQTSLAQKWCLDNGIELDTELVFQDLGVSAYHGKNMKQALGRFMECVEEGIVSKGSYLLVEALDRVSREKVLDVVNTLQSIVSQGITLVDLSSGKAYNKETLNNAFGLMEIIIHAERAHDESVQKGRRHKENWKGKRIKAKESGKAMTKICPAWLEIKEDYSGFVIKEERDLIVKRIFQEFIKGTSCNKIAEGLNQEGIASWTKDQKRGAQFWRGSYVKKILINPSVLGILQTTTTTRDNEGKRINTPSERIEGYYPAIISKYYWDKAQERFSRGSLTGGAAHKGSVPNILGGGLARCPLCGSTMTLGSREKKGSTRYYKCSKRLAGGDCVWTSVRNDRVNEAILNLGARMLTRYPDESDIHRELFWKNVAHEKHIERTKNFVEQEATLRKQIENITEAIATGIDSIALTTKLRDLEYELARVQDESKEAQKNLQFNDNPKNIKLRLDKLKKVAQEKDIEKVNEVLRILFDEVVLDHVKGGLVFTWKHNENIKTFVPCSNIKKPQK